MQRRCCGLVPGSWTCASVARFLKALVDIEALDGIVQHAMYRAMKAEDAKALVRHHTTHHDHQFQPV